MKTARGLEVSQSIADLFWSHVDRNGPIHPTLGTRCELWTAHLNLKGYGVFGLALGHGKSRLVLAHRVASAIEDGPIPPGVLILHVNGCSSRSCVRHTYRGTQKQNVADAVALRLHTSVATKPRKPRKRLTRCRRGHALSGPTVRFTRRNRCYICAQAAAHIRREKEKNPTPGHLTIERVQVARFLASATTLSQAAIGRLFKVTSPAIGFALRRETWAHVPELQVGAVDNG